MGTWIWWAVAAAALGLAEVVTTTLVLIMLAGGAAAAAAAAAAGTNVAIQVAVFVVVSLALLGLVRPVARRHLMSNVPETRTGVAKLVGQRAVVLERVDGSDGRVKIGGEVWTARSYDGESVFEAGQAVDVAQIDGATALVL